MHAAVLSVHVADGVGSNANEQPREATFTRTAFRSNLELTFQPEC